MIIEFHRRNGTSKAFHWPLISGGLSSDHLREFVPLVFEDRDYSLDQWLIILPVLSLLSGFVAYLIWNGSVSYTFGLPKLGFWQVYFVNWLLGTIGSHFKSSCTK